MNKLILIQTYFGKLPNFFELWLNSAKKNSDIDFLIVTDDDTSRYELSSNIKVIKSSLENVSNLISEKLEMNIKIVNPYKLCDFKPFYGKIFEDHLNNYTHWGYFDFDMYLGNLNKFITQEILQEYDKVGIYGHLTIFKNNIRMMEFILDSDNWPYSLESTLASKKLFALDEAAGINIAVNSSNLKQKQLVISDINYMLPIWSDVRFDWPYQFFYVVDGNVYVARSRADRKEIIIEEVTYIHYQKRKIDFHGVDLEKPFYFSNQGIFNFSKEKLIELIFSVEISKSYRKKYILKNAILKLKLYLTNNSPYSIKIKYSQSKMEKKFQAERPVNVIKVEKL